jgi:hypothetical protein
MSWRRPVDDAERIAFTRRIAVRLAKAPDDALGEGRETFDEPEHARAYAFGVLTTQVHEAVVDLLRTIGDEGAATAYAESWAAEEGNRKARAELKSLAVALRGPELEQLVELGKRLLEKTNEPREP